MICDDKMGTSGGLVCGVKGVPPDKERSEEAHALKVPCGQPFYFLWWPYSYSAFTAKPQFY